MSGWICFGNTTAVPSTKLFLIGIELTDSQKRCCPSLTDNNQQASVFTTIATFLFYIMLSPANAVWKKKKRRFEKVRVRKLFVFTVLLLSDFANGIN